MFLDTIASDAFFASNAATFLIEGSAREDDPESKFSKKDDGQFRSMNHFYDPLDTNFGKGLSDTPVLQRTSFLGYGGVA
jgi:hypothetical protein